MDLDLPAYQGVGWLPRRSPRGWRDDGWSGHGVGDQWSPLLRASLLLPSADWPAPNDWRSVQYLRPVSFDALRQELIMYAATLEGLGVEVVKVELPGRLAGDSVPFNAVFARDLVTMTPAGAICARMASEVRAGEEVLGQEMLALARVPVLARVHGSAVHEGADLLWIDPGRALLGVGARTDSAAAVQIRAVLASLGASLNLVPVPTGVQHLLGILQIVGPETAVVRGRLLPRWALASLRDLGFSLVDLDESDEVTRLQAMNLTVLGPGKVVMAAGCPDTERALRESGLDVVATVSIPNLCAAGGGLACATAILERG